jgi:bacillolysin
MKASSLGGLLDGVTKREAGLVTKGESGALNESFSDIFAILIKNWDFTKQDGGDASSWNREIGSGLAASGGALRDLEDPTRSGAPNHMAGWKTYRADSGGVHPNSCIHSKAAHDLLVASDQGRRIFAPYETALLYYHCLLRLGSQSLFSDAFRALIDAAESRYKGSGTENQAGCNRQRLRGRRDKR